MPVPKKDPVNPMVEVEEGETPPTTLESIGLAPQEVVVGEPETVQGRPGGGPVSVPTFRIRVNKDIENMSYVGYFGAEHYTFEQGHEYDGVPIYIVEELERTGSIWH